MSKKTPFFSHDMNARHDTKISAMRGVYGPQGYGWWWVLIEIMAETDGYQLDCKSKYVFNAYAMQMQCKSEESHKFITDCIKEFELFESDGHHFWSNSLRKRMEYRDSVSEKRAEAANKRWNKSNPNANASKDDANAMQNDANETKQNKTKQNNKDNNTFSAYTSNTDLLEALNSFSEMRTKIKKPLTDRAKKMLVNKLDKLSSNNDDKILILEQSIFKSWQDIFVVKESGGSSTVGRTGIAAYREDPPVRKIHEFLADEEAKKEKLLSEVRGMF